MKTIAISNDVLRVLSAANLDGKRLVLEGQIDRKLYLETNKVIEAAGGKWNRKVGAHVFDRDAAEVVEPIILTGDYGRPKQDFGQFDSPPAVVDRVMELANIEPGMAVLEPSAGLGHIAIAAAARRGMVMCYEVDEKRCDHLVKASGQASHRLDMVVHRDFLTVPPAAVYHRVVMNPPFARQADIEHVTHALKFLRAAGRLVSVMSAGVMFREDRKSAAFRRMVADFGGTIERLPDGAFRESGTMVSACVVVVGGGSS